ncbi:PVC-type heme-binding CxxCH protein [Anatilimnocola floriformis]|uniref:PVC-type heme-binding CxxCH protein n=1 Tax=Anatilimnocola floriformis TaxID=2948575 RepID=UPI0020C4FAE3|nr:PVC-type heme-binding CxxCH protein [Anatilimnocola floriformis]
MNLRHLYAGLAIHLAFIAAAIAQRDLKNIPDPDPEEERKTFVVPEGFEVSLYAADPLLAKPIQMNFDAQGRLWIASSEVYPQIKPGQKAVDKILVIEDKDKNGVAETTTVFADGLLIPTGVIPDDRGGCYVANSTELVHFADTDGDLKQDKRTVILTGFGTEDTHHLLHTLRWGVDGCLYMNQSIYIHSHIETPYGVKRLNGGGIWRFRPETLELEVLAYGFVNAWGHHQDRWGQSFATDGAYGEGINYVFPGSVFVSAPNAKRIMTGLNPGQPKECGLEIIGGRHLPPEWDGSMITNDFRAHRVCRFTVTEDGSGYASKQEMDLIKTPHVAFRPIDVKMGPDGCVYVADWYNPIIQHGEVDFRDERRDHTHGRIWRVKAKGRQLLRTETAADTSTEKLLDQLRTPEEWVRQHAKNMLKNRHWSGTSVAEALAKWVAAIPATATNRDALRLESLWVYESIDKVEPKLLGELLQSSDHRVRAAAVRTAVHWQKKLPAGELLQIASQACSDENPRVRLEGIRAAAEVPDSRAAEAALGALNRPMDRFLDFALWTTMRDLSEVWLPALKEGNFNVGDVNQLTFALKAADSPEVVAPLLTLIKQGKIPADRVEGVLTLVASMGGPKELGAVFELIVAGDGSLADAKKAALLDALRDTTRLRKIQPAGDLARVISLLQSPDEKLRAAALRAAGQWKLAAATAAIAAHAEADNQPAAVRQAAIEALALAGNSNQQLLAALAGKGRPLADRQQAIAALASLDVKATADSAVVLLAEAPAGLDPVAALQPLLARKEGTAALTTALAEQKISADVAKLVIRAAQSAPQPSLELIASVQKAGGLDAAGWKLTPAFSAELVTLAREQGNAQRGEAIYRSAQLQCLKCHAIAGAGGVVGPDLVSIGASAQPDYILESLITPAAKVKEGYHAKLVLEASGQVYTGLVVRDSKDELVLRTAEDKLITLAKSDIEGIKDSRSLMPDGAVDSLTKTELTDLVRFLSELGKVGGEFTVGQQRVVRRWQVLENSPAAQQKLSRTLDAAASDDAAFTWQSAYSRVAGELPLDNLPILKTEAKIARPTLLRAQLEVSTAGKVAWQLEDAKGVQVWVDGKSQAIADGKFALDLKTGLHTITLAVDRDTHQSPVKLSLVEGAASTAKVQLVGGK